MTSIKHAGEDMHIEDAANEELRLLAGEDSHVADVEAEALLPSPYEGISDEGLLRQQGRIY